MTVLMIFFAVFCVFLNSPAQFLSSATDSRASALGGAFVSLSDNSSAVFYNPSGLARLSRNHLSVYYEPALFGMSEISTGAVTFAGPFGFVSAGLGLRTFGFDLYRESIAAVSAAISAGRGFLTGATVNFYNLSISGYGSASSAGIDLGVIADISDELKWGFAVKNLAGSRIGVSRSAISRFYSTGFSFSAAGGVILAGEIEKESGLPVRFRAGAEANPVRPVYLRAGISTEPSSFSAGLGFRYGMICADYCANFTEPLGITNRFNVSFEF